MSGVIRRGTRIGPQLCHQAQPSLTQAARALFLPGTILMQLMVPLETDSHQALMDLSNPLFSLIIPPLGWY